MKLNHFGIETNIGELPSLKEKQGAYAELLACPWWRVFKRRRLRRKYLELRYRVQAEFINKVIEMAESRIET